MPSRRARSGLRASSAVRSNGPPSATEIFLTDNQARDHLTKAELALDKDGKFLAMRVATLRPGNPNLVLWHLARWSWWSDFFGRYRPAGINQQRDGRSRMHCPHPFTHRDLRVFSQAITSVSTPE
jgi:hypothetical protein